MRKLLMAILVALPLFAQADLDLSASPLRPYIEAFNVDRINLLRYYSVDLAPERSARLKRYYGEWRERLEKINFDALPQDGKVDYVVFRNYLNHELQKLDFDAKSLEETAGTFRLPRPLSTWRKRAGRLLR
jgi:hypothetical protein